MCNALIVDDNATFRAVIKEILHSRFPTMKIEGERCANYQIVS